MGKYKLFKTQVITNETGEIIESQEFRGPNADQEADAWIAQRVQGGELVGMLYGSEFERSIVKQDESAEYEKQMEVQDRTLSRNFCLWVIDAIAAYNKANMSEPQMLAIFSTPAFQGIILALLTGGTKTARNLIAQVGPSLYPADFVAEIVAAMDEQIVKEEPPAPEPEESEEGEGQGVDGENPTQDESSSEPV